jgi:hypothetical protein
MSALAPRRLARRPEPRGYGRLRPVADQDTGIALLSLPRGFRYRELPASTTQGPAAVGGGAARLDGVLYRGEDRGIACLYRVVPLERGATVQALAVRGRPGFDVAEAVPGLAYRTEWVAGEHPRRAGATTFPRHAGLAAAGGRVLVCCPGGGAAGLGQLWAFQPRGPLGGVLTLAGERRVRGSFERPALLGSLPGDDRVLLAAGGEVRVRDAGGAEHPLVRVRSLPATVRGARFDPDGRTLHLDVQGEHLGAPARTFAIRGPFAR